VSSLVSAVPAFPATDHPPPLAGNRIVVGIGEFAVSGLPNHTIVTHALGSCVAVCVWDPAAMVAGLLHLLLPDSRLNPARAAAQPAVFADLGIPLLFQTAYRAGLDKRRCRVRIVGGAEISLGTELNVGRRNVLAAKNILWRNGVMVAAEETGGSVPRTVALKVSCGTLTISTGRDIRELRLDAKP
jgi:chemotaxis protein CheD